MRRFVLLLCLVPALSCSSDGSSDAGGDAGDSDTGPTMDVATDSEGDVGTGADVASDTMVPPDSTPDGDPEWVASIVDPSGVDAIDQYINAGATESVLYPVTTQFYESYGDDYDFLYLLAEVPQGSGRFAHARYDDVPGMGRDGVFEDPGFGSPERLRGVVALNLTTSGNGPTIHETGHFWMMFLDDQFGFGRDRDTFFGPHWGTASTNGQMGGFDWSTIRCVGGTALPCTASGDGRIGYEIGGFGPTANGGDGVPYAMIELYLMGLASASEITEPIRVLQDASFQEYDEARDIISFDTAGYEEVTIDQIVAVHGERPPASDDERAMRGAFVLVTALAPTQQQLDAAENWARVFGDDIDSSFLLSFADATGGRATMDTRIWP